MKNNKKIPPRKGYKGYRLHDKRISYSGGEGSIRTIKYELKNPDGIFKLKDCIADAIESDYRTLYGGISFTDYLEGKQNTPNFLDFWLKSLSLGFVFANTNNIKESFFDYKKIETNYSKVFKSLPKDLQLILDQKKFIGFLIKSQRNIEEKNIEGKKKIIYNLLKKPKDEEGKNIIEPFALKFAENISKKDQLNVKCEIFKIKAPKNIDLETPLIQNEDGKYEKLNISWTVDPAFNTKEFNIPDKTSLFEKLINYYENKTNSITTKMFLSLGNNGSYFNNGALGSLFEYTHSGKYNNELTNYLSEVYNFNNNQKEEIKYRFDTLTKYARQISKYPKLVKNWSDYIGNFNGTIESWYSNRENKQNEVKNQLNELEKSLILLKTFIKKYDDSKNIISNIDFIFNIIVDAKKDNQIDNNENKTISDILSEIRTQTNEWRQKHEKEEGFEFPTMTKDDDYDKKKVSVLTTLNKNIQTSPKFFGESAKIKYTEILNVRENVIKRLDGLEEIYNLIYDKIDKNKIITDRYVDSLSISSQRIENKKIKNIFNFLSQTLQADFTKRDRKNKFFISGYEREKDIKSLPFKKDIKIIEIIKTIDLKKLFKECGNEPQNDNFLRDLNSLSRILFSLILNGLPENFEINKTTINLNNFSDRTNKIIRDNKIDINKLRLIQVFTHSDLSGYASIITKKKFISRYAIQSTNGGQNLLGIGKGTTKKGISNERYFYFFPKMENEEKINLLKIQEYKSHLNTDFYDPKLNNKTKEPEKYTALQVYSSNYQIQFLDWFFGKHKKKQTELEIRGSFSISETEVDIDWNNKTPRIKNKSEPRVFISQPFKMKLKKEMKAKIDLKKSKNNFIGVDIGEYGLAWSLIEISKGVIIKKEEGFITDNQHKFLKSDVKKWRENQIRQTFSSTNTKISRLRESIIGSYRNQLHNLLIKNNATLSFEYEVSAFESGGNKIAKIYDSIKRADVIKITKAEEMDRNQAWGYTGKKENFSWAKETTAQGTSQFCTKCRRWSGLDIDDNTNYTLETYQDGLFKTKLNSGEYVRLFSNTDKSGDKIKGLDLKKCIYKAMRPNEKGSGMDIVKKNKDWSKLSQIFGEDKPRGNIAIFICPYIKCQHISDADKQASFNIAVRGYLKQRELDKVNNDNKKMPILDRKFLCEEESKILEKSQNIRPIELK